jgi:uncharacterized coiled-coil protein SlyX
MEIIVATAAAIAGMLFAAWRFRAEAPLFGITPKDESYVVSAAEAAIADMRREITEGLNGIRDMLSDTTTSAPSRMPGNPAAGNMTTFDTTDHSFSETSGDYSSLAPHMVAQSQRLDQIADNLAHHDKQISKLARMVTQLATELQKTNEAANGAAQMVQVNASRLGNEVATRGMVTAGLQQSIAEIAANQKRLVMEVANALGMGVGGEDDEESDDDVEENSDENFDENVEENFEENGAELAQQDGVELLHPHVVKSTDELLQHSPQKKSENLGTSVESTNFLSIARKPHEHGLTEK